MVPYLFFLPAILRYTNDHLCLVWGKKGRKNVYKVKSRVEWKMRGRRGMDTSGEHFCKKLAFLVSLDWEVTKSGKEQPQGYLQLV